MQTDFKEATMFRHACRVAVLAGAVAATLALAGNALANPTRPTISSPTSTSVLAGNLTVRWTPSTFGDPGMIAGLYRLHVSDTTGGTMTSLPDPPAVLAPATSTTITV